MNPKRVGVKEIKMDVRRRVGEKIKKMAVSDEKAV